MQERKRSQRTRSRALLGVVCGELFWRFEYDDAGLANIGVDRSTIRLALGYVNEADEVIADLAAALPARAGGDFHDDEPEPAARRPG